MKSVFQTLRIAFIVFIINACSNDFLNENLSAVQTITGESFIYISPEWDEDTYFFSCPIAKNIEFSIEEAPEWLQVASSTGNLTFSTSNNINAKSIGSIKAKAKPFDAFAKTGIYIAYLKIKADGIIYQIPVYYVSEGNPKASVDQSLTINYNSFSNPLLKIRNTGNGILMWNIVSMPEWLQVNMDNNLIESYLIPNGSSYSVPFGLNPNADFDDNLLNGTIVLQTNDDEKENITIPVSANLGTPQLYISGLYSGRLDFNASSLSYSVSLQNQGNGLLAWQITDLPEWLTVNESKGNLLSYYSESINFTCDTEKLSSGQNTATIKLKSNATNSGAISIEVTARGAGNNAATFPIDGKVVDAAVVRSRNIMVYATSQPNKLVFYDFNSKAIANEVLLTKAPTCFAIAEDFSTAAVGHGGMITAINLNNYTVSKTIELSNSVYDIAWAGATQYWYAEQTDYSDSLYIVDCVDGTKTNASVRDVDGKTKIKKVPTQPYIIATRQQSSPSGFITVDIAGKKVQSYAHKDLGDFWFSENGEYIFARSGDIYRANNAISSTNTFNATINSIGKFKDSNGGTQYYPWWADHLASKGKIYVVNYHYSYQYVIHQFDDNDYLLQKSYAYDKIYQPNSQSTAFEVQAHYVFANSENTTLFVLRKGKADDNNIWSMELLEIK